MNNLEIFQEVYGKDHVFTVTELTRLQKVAELIARECQAEKKFNPDWDAMSTMVEEQQRMAKRIEELEHCLIVKQEHNEMLMAKQEPVAWMTINDYGEEDDIWYTNPEGKLIDGWTYKPLYTSPPQRQPLTDEEISNAWLFLEGKAAGVLQEGGEFNFPVEFYKYIKELTE